MAKQVYLSDIRKIEKLLTGQRQQLVIYDPKSELVRDEDVKEIHVFKESLHLCTLMSELNTTAYSVVLLSGMPKMPALPASVILISFVKLKQRFASPYHRTVWSYATNASNTMSWIGSGHSRKNFWLDRQCAKQLFPLAGKFIFRVLRFFLGKLYIYHQQTLFIDEQLENIDYDHYTVSFDYFDQKKKVLLELHRHDETFAVAKFALDQAARNSLKQEVATLENCHALMLSFLACPSIIKSTEYLLVLNHSVYPVHLYPATFSVVHLEALKEIYYQTDESVRFTASSLFEEIYENIGQIERPIAQELTQESVFGLQSLLTDLLLAFEDSTIVQISFAHNNFTASNTQVCENKLQVYNWEQAKQGYPVLFDFFHFIFHTKIVVQGQGLAEVKMEIDHWKKNPWMVEFLSDFNIDFSVYYQLYLLISVPKGLLALSQAPTCTPADQKMLTIWQDALEEVLMEKNLSDLTA